MKRDAIEKRLRELEAERGKVTADALVDSAKDPDDELHDLFEWDDSKAGAQWRLHQARAIIRSVTITVTVGHTELTAPAYVHDETETSGYRSINVIKQNEDSAREVVVAEFSRAAAALRRAKAVAAALKIEDEVEDIVVRVDSLRSRMVAQETAEA